MLFPKAAIAFLALFPHQTLSSACLNSQTYTYNIFGQDRKCSNIRLNETRRQAACQVQEVRLNCPQTCGICCEDDPDYQFEVQSTGNVVSCSWLLQRNAEKRVGKYCEPGVLGSDNKNIRNGCPDSCDFCKSLVTLPTSSPTKAPGKAPTKTPTKAPSKAPTKAPSMAPSKTPTKAPVAGTTAPTKSMAPSAGPNASPSEAPSDEPTRPPSPMPSPFPTSSPTRMPSISPTRVPSESPSHPPSQVPSESPSDIPSFVPSDAPSQVPSESPSDRPSDNPTTSIKPSATPSVAPIGPPTKKPTSAPSAAPSKAPSTSAPTKAPTKAPTSAPSKAPTKSPSISATSAPTKIPTKSPTKAPTATPTTTDCTDSTTYTFLVDVNDAVVDCTWLTKRNADTRKAKYCPRAEIKTECQSTCQYCECVDDTSHTWELSSNGNVVDCTWLTKRNTSKRLAKWCGEVEDYCTLSCESVGTYQC